MQKLIPYNIFNRGHALRTAVGIMLVLVIAGGAGATKFINDVTGGDCTSIGTWNDVTKTCTMTTDLSEGIQIDSDGITLDGNGHTIADFSGVTVQSNGVTIKNLNVKFANVGIKVLGNQSNITNNTAYSNDFGFLISGNQNNITNNAAYSNAAGISISGNQNNITNNAAYSNNFYGIVISYNQNNVKNNTVVSNFYGIYIDSGNQNNITNNTVNSSTYGMFIFGDQNNITNNIDNSNIRDGIVLFTANNNTLSSNKVFNNSNGISLADSNDNTIYNNYFNNTNNFDINAIKNIWNITKTLGTNIVGGPYLGGNFWANPEGTGFSQTCLNKDSDGICDSTYILNTNTENVDYLPLTLLTINIPKPYGTYPVGTELDFSAVGLSVSGKLTNSIGETTVINSGFKPGLGIYTLVVTATDDAGNIVATSGPIFFVVYDPNGGYVTGGGWIDSPAGAYSADPTLIGLANFGFVSQYKKGATIPTGVTEFQFKVADLDFHSDTYEWLVVAGARAQYKGTGTINHAGNYGFVLTAIDGQINGGGGSDKFRIKIEDKATGQIVYDNQKGAENNADPTTIIGGGSIVVHKVEN